MEAGPAEGVGARACLQLLQRLAYAPRQLLLTCILINAPDGWSMHRGRGLLFTARSTLPRVDTLNWPQEPFKSKFVVSLCAKLKMHSVV